MLGGFGLDFARRGKARHQRQMDEHGVAAADLQAKLPRGFEERLRLDVAHRAADLDDDYIETLAHGPDSALDLVGDVRNDLDGAPLVVAAAFLADDLVVDAAGGEVVQLRHAHAANEPFVVAEVEVRLGAIRRDEHLAVLERAHRAGIDIDVGVHLEDVDLEAACFENCRQRGRDDALAERGHDPAGYEDVLGRSHL